MKIRHIAIRRFRGIKSLEWAIPDKSVLCLIGAGDTGKSSVLEAVKLCFFPRWNLTLTDSDFHASSIEDPIEIEITFGDLSPELSDINRYGRQIRGWNVAKMALNDEPKEGDEEVLTASLVVDSTLEPRWRIISDRDRDNFEFRTKDRVNVAVTFIGVYSDRELTWGAGTAMAAITNPKDVGTALIGATRAARHSIEAHRGDALKSFDAAAKKAQTVAGELGIPTTEFKANLDLAALNIGMGGLSLHDGDKPVRLLGLGSKRMLLCGVQKEDRTQGHVTMLDEIELGLEPHRIVRLVDHIRSDASGQYLLSTHSPSVIRELSFENLFVVHNVHGDMRILWAADPSLATLNAQAT